MIALLRGNILDISGNRLTLDVSGVGYEVTCTSGLLAQAQAGEDIEVVIYTDVREDNIQLFGFSDQLEKQVFLLLTAVKGVGARSASEILSRIEKKDLLRIIGAADVGELQRIKGIGRKTAERIIVELKDRVGTFLQDSGVLAGGLAGRIEVESMSPAQEAIEALCALGFAKSEAERAVHQVQKLNGVAAENASNIVKEALRYV